MNEIEVRQTSVEVATATTSIVVIERDASGAVIEPKCPQCHSLVGRPHCLFDLGAACPRHPLREAWIRARVAVGGAHA